MWRCTEPFRRYCGMSILSRCSASGALIALTVTLTACPGSIENRERFLDGAVFDCSDPLDVPTAVFKRNCNNEICHDSEEPAGDLDLDSPDLLSRLIGVPGTDCTERLRIDPNNPDQSFLLDKLESRVPECGDRMPLGGSLPTDVIDCVRQWVHLVAPGAGDAGETVPEASEGSAEDAGDGSTEP